ncbi:MAG: SMP-30/gluconolactonase/LRE family protein [Zoogloeaceae bacterium]|nr:SMP-30/gluconolactonase/LRE family protein [Zoogloeaceae bacterium]
MKTEKSPVLRLFFLALCVLAMEVIVSPFAGRGATGFFAGGYVRASETAPPSPVWIDFFSPHGIAVDAMGNLYVTDKGKGRILKLSPKGKVSTFVGGKKGFTEGIESWGKPFFPGWGSYFDEGFYFVIGDITIDAAGNLYVAGGGYIHKITARGETSIVFGPGLGHSGYFHNLDGITIDKAGNLYVTDASQNCICMVTQKGEIPLIVDSCGGSISYYYYAPDGSIFYFYAPEDIAIDAAGNLYVTNSGSNSILKVTMEGEVSLFAGGGYGFADGKGSAAKFRSPSGIATDEAGNFYVVDTGNHSIRKVTKEGEVSTLAGSGKKGFADGKGRAAQFCRPHGITIDKAGNLYVADSGNRRIRKVTKEGEVSTFFAHIERDAAGQAHQCVECEAGQECVECETGQEQQCVRRIEHLYPRSFPRSADF